MTLGGNVEYGRTTFTNKGQNAYVDSSQGMVAVDAYQDQANITSTNGRYGLFATDTLDVTEKMAVTASARLDYAAVQLNGSACTGSDYNDNELCGFGGTDTWTSVTGNHSYTRLNPSLGSTYQVSPLTTAFATYSEGFRTPSAIELACADPNTPCSGIPNAFGADPYLKAVVSKTLELGLRGKISDAANWNLAVFRTDLYNDILFNATSVTAGYFSNVGQTRRQGLELGVYGNTDRFDYAANLSWIEATFQSSFQIANGANSTCTLQGDSTTCPSNKAGDKIPGIPEGMLKLKLGYAATPQTRIGTVLTAQGPQYARGDENNLDSNGKVPGYVIMNLDISHRTSKTLELFGGISNVFDKTYATYGVLGDNNLSATGSTTYEQFRSYGAPRAYYAGVRGNF
jgi:outer membrane receptor protein involved in Fe transport